MPAREEGKSWGNSTWESSSCSTCDCFAAGPQSAEDADPTKMSTRSLACTAQLHHAVHCNQRGLLQVRRSCEEQRTIQERIPLQAYTEPLSLNMVMRYPTQGNARGGGQWRSIHLCCHICILKDISAALSTVRPSCPCSTALAATCFAEPCHLMMVRPCRRRHARTDDM